MRELVCFHVSCDMRFQQQPGLLRSPSTAVAGQTHIIRARPNAGKLLTCLYDSLVASMSHCNSLSSPLGCVNFNQGDSRTDVAVDFYLKSLTFAIGNSGGQSK